MAAHRDHRGFKMIQLQLDARFGFLDDVAENHIAGVVADDAPQRGVGQPHIAPGQPVFVQLARGEKIVRSVLRSR